MREDLAGHTVGPPLMSSCGDGSCEEVMSHSCRAGHSVALGDTLRARDQAQPLQVHNLHNLFSHFLPPLKPPRCLEEQQCPERAEVAAQEVSKCITKQSPKLSMAGTRDLKTGCEALETPAATPETVDSQTTRAKFDHSLLFNALHRLTEPFRPLSSLSPTTNLPLTSPASPQKPLHRLKLHPNRQSWNEGQPSPFSTEGKLRHRRVMLLQRSGRGWKSTGGGKCCLSPAKHVW